MKAIRFTCFALTILSLMVALASPSNGQTNPVLIATATDDYAGPLYHLALSGDHVFMSVGWNAYVARWVYDISNPTNPVPVGPVSNLRGQAIVVDGNYAYVATGADVAIYNVSDPTNAVMVGQITNAYRLAISGKYAYVIVGPNDFYIYDVSDPAAPISVGHTTFADPGPNYNIAVSSAHAYIATGANLCVYDVSNPTNPISVGPDGLAPGAVEVFVSGNSAYVGVALTNMDYGTTIYDISIPTNPVKSGRIWGFGCQNAAVSGNYLYLADGDLGSPGLGIFDVSDPSRPLQVAGVGIGYNGYTCVAVRGSYAYVSADDAALRVFWLGASAPPKLGVSHSVDGRVVLSWPTPTAAFSVQQSSALNIPTWVTLTNSPVTVGSQNEVTIPAPAGTMFYRLVSQ